jgi:prepilin-type N-terminal cleavage/methylation domain-containing protein
MRTLHREDGFTLVEVLVAIVVFSVALLGMAGLMINIVNVNVSSKKITAATTFAYDKIENLKTLNFANVPAAAGAEAWNPQTKSWSSISPTDPYVVYKRVTSVDTASMPPGMANVSVSVFWDADKHSVAFNTILSQ